MNFFLDKLLLYLFILDFIVYSLKICGLLKQFQESTDFIYEILLNFESYFCLDFFLLYSLNLHHLLFDLIFMNKEYFCEDHLHFRFLSINQLLIGIYSRYQELVPLSTSTPFFLEIFILFLPKLLNISVSLLFVKLIVTSLLILF